MVVRLKMILIVFFNFNSMMDNVHVDQVSVDGNVTSAKQTSGAIQTCSVTVSLMH